MGFMTCGYGDIPMRSLARDDSRFNDDMMIGEHGFF